MYGQSKCIYKNVYTIVLTLKCIYKLKEFVMTKDKLFSMRCTQDFLDDLATLSNEMGLSKAATVELTINIYPGLVKLMIKHEDMLAKLREDL